MEEKGNVDQGKELDEYKNEGRDGNEAGERKTGMVDRALARLP